MLERRDPAIYGGLSLSELEMRIQRDARELGLEAMFFQTNAEGEFAEYLHRAPERADAISSTPAPGPTTAGRSPTRSS